MKWVIIAITLLCIIYVAKTGKTSGFSDHASRGYGKILNKNK
jgi:hypothetical protein